MSRTNVLVKITGFWLLIKLQVCASLCNEMPWTWTHFNIAHFPIHHKRENCSLDERSQ